MSRLSFTVELATDGGVVVYADNGGEEQALVFAGNTKDTCDYIAKRVGGLTADKAEAYEDPFLQKVHVTNTPRVNPSFREVYEQYKKTDDVGGTVNREAKV